MSDSQTHVPFLAPEPSQLAPLFPGYEIENLIATGGMGAVYRAVQKSLDRTVAIKILPREFSNDAAFCAGFEAEAKAMARLNHPNLIGVYDFGEVDGMLYIIMEFVPGKSIFHSAHGIAINPDEVIRLVTGICNGLSHAHENGIIHRDIKPSNILLDLNAQPKIGDFGLARPIETKVQEGEEIFGTPHYTAPEVVNSPQSVGYRADIFSVGVLLHELLTGRLPAEDQRPASAIVRCDIRFDAIIRRASNPLPELRYASAAEIARDLQAIAKSASPGIPRNPALTGPLPPTAKITRPSPTRGTRARPRKKSSSSPVPGIVKLLLAIAVSYFSYKFITNRMNQRTVTATIPAEPSDSTSQTPTTKSPPLPQEKPNYETNRPPLASLNPLPKPSNDTKPVPRPTPENTRSTIPKFDVEAFYTRARKIMRDRAAPRIASSDKELKDNLADFERALKRPIRKMDFGGAKDRAEQRLKDFIAQCEADGNHIPEKLNARSMAIWEIADIHPQFLQKQETIDSTLKQSLSQLSATYILGLEKQIERLKATDDPAAIDLIEEEIENTRKDASYFPNLMLDIDSTAQNR